MKTLEELFLWSWWFEAIKVYINRLFLLLAVEKHKCYTEGENLS